MPGLLYPAFQKFYSAISCLERFNREQDFFANIASLDTFFSEYRSITLVMQKSLTHTPYIDIYKKQVANGCFDPWLNAQRVKSVHTHPVEFSKQIDISIYFPDRKIELFSQSFTVENDIPLSSLKEKLKELFCRIHPTEIFFSAKYAFPEKDSGEDVLKKALGGIVSMLTFMNTMYQEVGEECPLCNQLLEKINKSQILHIPIDFMQIDDYVYYPRRNEFERAERMALVLGHPFTPQRSPLSGFNRIPSIRKDDYFQKFVIMHISMGTTELMPTIMTVYNDDTFSLDSFNANIKTTFYRKVNETANVIMSNNVREIYYMMVYVLCEYSEEKLLRSSKERLADGTVEFLVFMKVDSDLNEEEYVFEEKALSNQEHIAQQLKKGPKERLDFSVNNMAPIIEAFTKKRISPESQGIQ